MDAFGGIAAHPAQIELFDEVQFLQQHMAAGVGRRFVDVMPVVGGGDGRIPARAAVGEIAQGKQPALRLAELDDFPRRFALVECIAPAVNDGAEGAGQPRLAQDLPGPQRRAAGREHRLRVGKLLNHLVAGDNPGQHVADRKAVVGQINGGVQQFGQRPRTVPGMRRQPAVHQPRHRHRQYAFHRDAVATIQFRVGGIGRGAGSVANFHRAGLAVIHHNKPVAADARHIRLHHIQRGGGGNRGVKGVAAPLQSGHTGLRRQRMPGANHPVTPHNHRAVGFVLYTVRGGGHWRWPP